MVFVTRYHKGYNLTGNLKIIHRYLPREVGELLGAPTDHGLGAIPLVRSGTPN